MLRELPSRLMWVTIVAAWGMGWTHPTPQLSEELQPSSHKSQQVPAAAGRCTGCVHDVVSIAQWPPVRARFRSSGEPWGAQMVTLRRGQTHVIVLLSAHIRRMPRYRWMPEKNLVFQSSMRLLGGRGRGADCWSPVPWNRGTGSHFPSRAFRPTVTATRCRTCCGHKTADPRVVLLFCL